MKPGQPSRTALIVAAGLQLARPADEQRHLLPGAALSAGAALLEALHPRLAGLLRRGWFRALCRWLERRTLPGILLHYALRKRILRDAAQAALDAGCEQVVALGAGFDTLCAELSVAYPQLTCIEVDHPATQSHKRRAQPAGPVHYMAAELGQREVGAILADCPQFRSGRRTLFVAEGLLMYLPLDAVARLFAQMAAAAPDSRVAFTWFEPQADGKPNFRQRSRLVDVWLKLRGEPFLSGLARAELAGFLAAVGYTLEATRESGDQMTSIDGRVARAAPRPLAGEYIAFAQSK